MLHIATLADKLAAEAEAPEGDPWQARSLYEQLVTTATRFPARPAISFQLKSGPADKSVSITWADLRAEVTRAANLFRSLGVGPQDGVAFVLPNGLEAPIALLAGATAGIVVPINPLLAPEHIAAILRETGVKVVVTLAPFPQTDLAPRVDAAVALAPDVRAVLQVDLARYLPTPLAWAMPMMRPRLAATHKAQVLDFQGALKRQRADRLDFAETLDDRV
jgi:acyl-CoA synthetase (AMP-forming)/AMP-acid ligase II